jgi:hypothetical protein
MLKSWTYKKIRQEKRRNIRWLALGYWSWYWLMHSKEQRLFAQSQLLRVFAGFKHAEWVMAMHDFIKPEYWLI